MGARDDRRRHVAKETDPRPGQDDLKLERPKRLGPGDAPVHIGEILAEMFGRMILEAPERCGRGE